MTCDSFDSESAKPERVCIYNWCISGLRVYLIPYLDCQAFVESCGFPWKAMECFIWRISVDSSV